MPSFVAQAYNYPEESEHQGEVTRWWKAAGSRTLKAGMLESGFLEFLPILSRDKLQINALRRRSLRHFQKNGKYLERAVDNHNETYILEKVPRQSARWEHPKCSMGASSYIKVYYDMPFEKHASKRFT